MDYLVLETMNKAITSPVFVEQRHLIERVECFCPSPFFVYVRIKLQFSSYKMFVVKGTSLIPSHQYSVQRFLQSFLFYPYSISTPPSSFSFPSYFLFFNSFILHFYTSTAVDTCSLRLRIFYGSPHGGRSIRHYGEAVGISP